MAFIGHILTPDGLKPDPKKVEAINDMPHPTDVQSLRRFLGMVTYLAKFLPCLSDETEVLRKLTEKDAEWCWLTAHEEAVVRIQRMISTAPVLAYYDVTKPVTIQCDASQTGLGAALLQDGHPIAYSSRRALSHCLRMREVRPIHFRKERRSGRIRPQAATVDYI